jgi:hypothetical protein
VRTWLRSSLMCAKPAATTVAVGFQVRFAVDGGNQDEGEA